MNINVDGWKTDWPRMAMLAELGDAGLRIDHDANGTRVYCIGHLGERAAGIRPYELTPWFESLQQLEHHVEDTFGFLLDIIEEQDDLINRHVEKCDDLKKRLDAYIGLHR